MVRVPQPPGRRGAANHQLPPGRPHGAGRILTTGGVSGLTCRVAGQEQEVQCWPGVENSQVLGDISTTEQPATTRINYQQIAIANRQ
jgi:hypothetical protein